VIANGGAHAIRVTAGGHHGVTSCQCGTGESGTHSAARAGNRPNLLGHWGASFQVGSGWVSCRVRGRESPPTRRRRAALLEVSEEERLDTVERDLVLAVVEVHVVRVGDDDEFGVLR
jgi:hypothetical protein